MGSIRGRVVQGWRHDPWVARARLPARVHVRVGVERLGFERRPAAGAETVYTPGCYCSNSGWVRLIREGDLFLWYQSSDGVQWQLVGSETISMPAVIYVGLAVTSRNPDATSTATISDITVAGTNTNGAGTAPSTLPLPWRSSDIGGALPAGSAMLDSSGTFTVVAGGADIWNASDEFHFVYQPVSGDTDIIAQVSSLASAEAWSKAGVMIRGSLAPDSPHAFMFVSGWSGWGFERRPAAGAETVYTPGCYCSNSGWVRLVRQGDLFLAYQSSDGVQWQLVGSDMISMPAAVYAGLAVTSHSSGTSTTATLRNVSLGTPNNHSPIVSIVEPAKNATFVAPANIIVSASATDTDGNIQRVDFFQNQRLIGSSVAYPFWVNWLDVTAGTYGVTAVATDDAGATTTSTSVSVTVNSAQDGIGAYRPTTLIFGAPTDYATNVTSSTVELRRSVDGVTVSPVATKALGKPAVVNGDITVDISSIVDPLPAGSYYAIVVTTGSGGSTPSSPSPAFTK